MSTLVELASMLDSDPAHRDGRPFITGTRVSVDGIAVMHGWGYSAERIAEEKTLQLCQVYAALAYYLANQDTIDREIREADEESLRIANDWTAARHRRPA